MKDKTEQGIVIAGSGWIITGALCVILYFYQQNVALLAVGLMALSVGIGIIPLRKRIISLRDKLLKSKTYRLIQES